MLGGNVGLADGCLKSSSWLEVLAWMDTQICGRFTGIIQLSYLGAIKQAANAW